MHTDPSASSRAPAAAGLQIWCTPSRGWGGGGSGGRWLLQRIPQTATECLFFLFLFEKLLFKPTSPNKHLATQPSLALSQESCSRPGGCQAWGCSCPGPRAGPKGLIVLKHSLYCLIFQCPLQFLVSNLHICWNSIGCLLCSSEDRLGVSTMHSGEWTLLPPISLPSSPRSNFWT